MYIRSEIPKSSNMLISLKAKLGEDDSVMYFDVFFIFK